MPVLAGGWLIALVTAENVGEFFLIRSALQNRGDAGYPPSQPDAPVLPRFRAARSEVV